MSVKAISWALDEVIDTSPAETLVLFALADFADNEGVSWHPLDKLAQRARCSTRTLRTHFKTLEELGLLSREPRYAWCKDAEGPCATRPAHKHRSGTTYRLHLEVTRAQLQARIAEIKASEKSTEENFSSVEKTAEYQGKVHRGKFFPCGEVESSTVENLRSPQRKQSVTICNIDPSIKPPYQTTPNLSKERAREDFDFGVAGRGVGEAQTVSTPYGSNREPYPDSRDSGSGLLALAPPDVAAGYRVLDESLLLACLPEAMRGLDARGMTLVWSKLVPLLDEGATPGAIKAFLNSGNLPDRVSYMPGLVAARLARMVFKRPSTAGLETVRNVGIIENNGVVEPETAEQQASALVWERLSGLNVATRPTVLAMLVQRLREMRMSVLECAELAALQDLIALEENVFQDLAQQALADISGLKRVGVL